MDADRCDTALLKIRINQCTVYWVSAHPEVFFQCNYPYTFSVCGQNSMHMSVDDVKNFKKPCIAWIWMRAAVCIISVDCRQHVSYSKWQGNRHKLLLLWLSEKRKKNQDSTPISFSDIYLFFQLFDLNPNKHSECDCSHFYMFFLWKINYHTCLSLNTVCVCQQFISAIFHNMLLK